MNEVFVSEKPIKQGKSKLETSFLRLMIENDISEPIQEYRFNPKRRWRFDFAWIDKKVAVEIDGSIWTQGRHSRGKGMIRDCEKRNWAITHGWKVLRYAGDNFSNAVEDVRELLK